MKKIDLFLVYLRKCSPVALRSQQGFGSPAESAVLLSYMWSSSIRFFIQQLPTEGPLRIYAAVEDIQDFKEM